MTGRHPKEEVDHRNGNSLDDRWSNLREATRYQNEANKGPYRNNASGLKGIRNHRGRWEAAIQVRESAAILAASVTSMRHTQHM
jgi:hypothetical protein